MKVKVDKSCLAKLSALAKSGAAKGLDFLWFDGQWLVASNGYALYATRKHTLGSVLESPSVLVASALKEGKVALAVVEKNLLKKWRGLVPSLDVRARVAIPSFFAKREYQHSPVAMELGDRRLVWEHASNLAHVAGETLTLGLDLVNDGALIVAADEADDPSILALIQGGLWGEGNVVMSFKAQEASGRICPLGEAPAQPVTKPAPPEKPRLVAPTPEPKPKAEPKPKPEPKPKAEPKQLDETQPKLSPREAKEARSLKAKERVAKAKRSQVINLHQYRAKRLRDGIDRSTCCECEHKVKWQEWIVAVDVPYHPKWPMGSCVSGYHICPKCDAFQEHTMFDGFIYVENGVLKCELSIEMMRQMLDNMNVPPGGTFKLGNAIFNAVRNEIVAALDDFAECLIPEDVFTLEQQRQIMRDELREVQAMLDEDKKNQQKMRAVAVGATVKKMIGEQ